MSDRTGKAGIPEAVADSLDPRLTGCSTGQRPGSTASTTDLDAHLYRKADGQACRLCFVGHARMENRHGLMVDVALTRATGTAEQEAALLMLDRRKRRHRITPGADKAYDVEAFVRALRVSPHVTVNGAISKTGKVRKIALDGRTTRHAGYAVSLRCRKRIQEVFGWIKAQAGLRKVKLRGRTKAETPFTFATAACNLVRPPKLMALSAA